MSILLTMRVSHNGRHRFSRDRNKKIGPGDHVNDKKYLVQPNLYLANCSASVEMTIHQTSHGWMTATMKKA